MHLQQKMDNSKTCPRKGRKPEQSWLRLWIQMFWKMTLETLHTNHLLWQICWHQWWQLWLSSEDLKTRGQDRMWCSNIERLDPQVVPLNGLKHDQSYAIDAQVSGPQKLSLEQLLNVNWVRRTNLRLGNRQSKEYDDKITVI